MPAEPKARPSPIRPEPQEPAGRQARVYHADLWGTRAVKRDWLESHSAYDTPWQAASARPGLYLFVPRDEAAMERYERFPSVTDLFPVHGVGIVTSRDAFVLDFDRDALERRIRQFLDPNMPDEVVRSAFGLKDNRDWKMAEKRSLLRQDDAWQDKIVQCLYRPFDRRWLLYHRHAIDFGREEVMCNMLDGTNLALITARSNKSQTQDQFFSSRWVVETKCGESTVQSYTLPLFAISGAIGEREPNLPAGLLPALAQAYGREVMPEDVFNYVYAVLYAPTYRERYADFLRTDFPRIPFTADADLFAALAALGARLVALHLLESPELDPPLARFEGDGDGRVAKGHPKFEPSAGVAQPPSAVNGPGHMSLAGRVWVNKTQYFAPVPEDVWTYQIGGYQVPHKWLKDRAGRRLGADDVRTYCRIVTALARTIAIQAEIDALYPDAEREIVPLSL